MILQMNIPHRKTILSFIPIDMISETHMYRSVSLSVSGRIALYLKYIFSFHLEHVKNMKHIFY